MTSDTRFCGGCGARVDSALATRFCTECGEPLAGTAAPAAVSQGAPYVLGPPVDVMTAVALPRPEVAAGRRGPLLVAGALAVVLTVGGGVAAAVVLTSPGSQAGSDGRPLTKAVTEAPERAWDWSTPDGSYVAGVQAAEGMVLVGADEGFSALALDAEDGHELWASDLGAPTLVSPDQDQVLLGQYEGPGIVAVDASTGEEQWRDDERFAMYYVSAGLLTGDDTSVSLVDPSTGEERWDVVTGNGFDVSKQYAFVYDGAQLRALSIDDAEEVWAQPVSTSSEYVSVTATEEMVVITDDGVTAYDADGGELLWTAVPGDDSASVEVFSDDRVVVTTQDYEDEYAEPEAYVYDPAGEVGRLDIDESYLGLTRLEVDGEEFAVSYSGRVYDSELVPVVRYPGQLTPVEGGVYSADDRGLVSYYDVPDNSPAWSASIGAGGDSGGYIVPLDGGIVVVADEGFTVYR